MATLSHSRHVETTGVDFRKKLLASDDAFGCMTDNELHGVLENFRAYLSILREWDKRDRAKEKTDSSPFCLIDQEGTDEV